MMVGRLTWSFAADTSGLRSWTTCFDSRSQIFMDSSVAAQSQ